MSVFLASMSLLVTAQPQEAVADQAVMGLRDCIALCEQYQTQQQTEPARDRKEQQPGSGGAAAGWVI